MYQVIDAPDDDREIVPSEAIRPGGALDHPAKTAAYGRQWLPDQRSLLLIVPSIVIPREHNNLINPGHPRAEALTTTFEAEVE